MMTWMVWVVSLLWFWRQSLTFLFLSVAAFASNSGDPSPPSKYWGLLCYFKKIESAQERWTESWPGTQNKTSALLLLNKTRNNWLDSGIAPPHTTYPPPPPNVPPRFRRLSQSHVQSEMWAIPSGVAAYNWAADANVFWDQSVVYYENEGEADGVL